MWKAGLKRTRRQHQIAESLYHDTRTLFLFYVHVGLTERYGKPLILYGVDFDL